MSSTKNLGRFAGLLYLVTSIVGFFAMGYVPGKLIVHGNAAATANNISASETLFRIALMLWLVIKGAKPPVQDVAAPSWSIG